MPLAPLRAALFVLAACLAAGCAHEEPAAPAADASSAPAPFAGTLVDLTHAFDAETIYWPTEEGFVRETTFDGHTDGGYYYAAGSFRSAEHGGTHLDAPVHFAEGRQTADAVPLERLIAPGVVIDVTEQAGADADYQVQVADFERWEAAHGPLPAGAIVLLHTGFGSRWPDRARYLGTEARGPEAVAELHFPGLHPDAARWLVAERDVAALGLDTPSIDYGQSTTFEAHRVLYEENIPAFENVAALDALPPSGFTVIALPMKIRGGSGAPLRIVAAVP